MPEEIQYTPFGTPIRKVDPVDCSQKLLPQFGLELDKETGCTYSVVKDSIDLDALIQTYKDSCGMEAAQLLLKRGLASPEDFAAKPGDYGDTSDLPDNINDAYQQSLAAGKFAAENGLDLSQFKTEKDITDFVNKKVQEALAAQKAQAATNVQGGKENA